MKLSINEVFKTVNISLPKNVQIYFMGLLTTEGKKTCTRMADQLSVSHDLINRSLNDASFSYHEQQLLFIELVNLIATPENPGHLCGDDTCMRRHSAKMQGVSYMHSGVDNKIVKGQSPVILAWSNSEVIIPIAWDFWLSKDSTSTYRSKPQIMQELIAQVNGKVPFKYVLLDGLYQSEAMMEYLDSQKINFEMRFPKNRKVKATENEDSVKIKNHKAFRLQRNQRSKARIGIINGKKRYIAIEKKKNRLGEYETYYLISNFEKTAKEYFSIYALRWNIEQLFRTTKQSLGLADCQAINLNKQKQHIFSVFSTFAIAEIIKINQNLATTGDAIRYVQNAISKKLSLSKLRIDQVFYAIA